MAENDIPQSESDKTKKEGNQCLLAGTGVGVIGVAGTLLTGAICPICIVATPGLLGVGLYKRWKAARQKQSTEDTTGK